MGQNGAFRRRREDAKKAYLKSNGSVIPVVRGESLYLVRNKHSFRLMNSFNGLPKDKIIGMLFVPPDGEDEKYGKWPLHLKAYTPRRDRPLHLIGIGRELKMTGEILINAAYSALAFDYNKRLFIVRAKDIDFAAKNNEPKNNKRKYYITNPLKLREGATIDSFVITDHGGWN